MFLHPDCPKFLWFPVLYVIWNLHSVHILFCSFLFVCCEVLQSCTMHEHIINIHPKAQGDFYASYLDSFSVKYFFFSIVSCKVKVKVKLLSRVWFLVTLWTIALQAPPSMRFSRQGYWSRLPFPSPGESSWPRDQTQVSCIAGRFFTLWATREFI